MCPACMASAGWIAAMVASGGGLGALVGGALLGKKRGKEEASRPPNSDRSAS